MHFAPPSNLAAGLALPSLWVYVRVTTIPPRPWSIIATNEKIGEYLDRLFLRCERVDDTYHPCLLAEDAHFIPSVLPPRPSKVVGPVRGRTRWRNVDKSSVRGIILADGCGGVDVRTDLYSGGM